MVYNSNNYCFLTWTQVLVLLIITQTYGELRNLYSVQIILRHGHREPDDSFLVPTGQLTNVGKRQMYNLGQFIRERYKDLIKEKYRVDELSIVASDNERAIQSGDLVALGLYRNGSRNANSSHIPFEPVPVRTVPANYDNFIRMTKPCPKHDRLFQPSFSRFVKEFVSRNEEFFKRYAEETGDWSVLDPNIEPERIQPFTFFQEKALYNLSLGIPLSPVAQEVTHDPNLQRFKADHDALYVDTPEKQALFIGPLLSRILSGFKADSPRLTIYSGHDRNLYTLMLTLGIWDAPLATPDFGASLIMELYKFEGTQHLKFWYRNGTGMYQKTVPTFGNSSRLEKFELYCKDVIDPKNQDCNAGMKTPMRNEAKSLTCKRFNK